MTGTHWKTSASLLLAAALAVPASCSKNRETPKSAAAGPAYDGNLDKADQDEICGWAWDKNSPNAPVKVGIYEGDRLVGTVTADQLRDDLREQGFGDGKHGFCFDTPESLKDGQPHAVWAAVAGTDFKLNTEPLAVTRSK